MTARLPSPLRALLKRGYHRLFHRHVQIAENSYVDRHARVDAGVKIGESSRVFLAHVQGASELGEHCLVSTFCRIGDSRLGSHVSLEPHAEVYNSTLGDTVRVQTRCYLNRVQLGRCSYVARETHLDDVSFGSFVSVGPRCIFGLGEHPADFCTTSPMFYSPRAQCGRSFASTSHFAERHRIHVGHDVWIGAHVFVRDGVTIGDGAIIAAGAVVNRNVPPYAIVGGVPAKLIRPRYRDDIVQRLLQLQWWHWDEPRLRAAQPLLAQPDIHAFLRWAAT